MPKIISKSKSKVKKLLSKVKKLKSNKKTKKMRGGNPDNNTKVYVRHDLIDEGFTDNFIDHFIKHEYYINNSFNGNIQKCSYLKENILNKFNNNQKEFEKFFIKIANQVFAPHGNLYMKYIIALMNAGFSKKYITSGEGKDRLVYDSKDNKDIEDSNFVKYSIKLMQTGYSEEFIKKNLSVDPKMNERIIRFKEEMHLTEKNLQNLEKRNPRKYRELFAGKIPYAELYINLEDYSNEGIFKDRN